MTFRRQPPECVLFVTLDSLRYDTAVRAVCPSLAKLGPPTRAMAPGYFTFASHAAKASTRLAINASPEPVSNWIASLAEDVTALLAIWMIFNHPLLMLGFVAVFVAAVVWMAPKVWRTLRRSFRRETPSGGGPDGLQSRAPEGGREVTLGGAQGG